MAYGLRARSLTAPFHFLGRYLGGFRDAIYPQSTVVLAGFLLQAAWTMAWCVVYALVAANANRPLRIILALTTSALAFLASSRIMGSALTTSGIGGSRWLFLHVVLAIALYKGTRFAP